MTGKELLEKLLMLKREELEYEVIMEGRDCIGHSDDLEVSGHNLYITRK